MKKQHTRKKLDLQLRKDRCYTLIYTNISSDLKNLITETTDGVAADIKRSLRTSHKSKGNSTIRSIFWNKIPTREDIFISRVKEQRQPDYKKRVILDDLYIGFQLTRWLPQEFQSCNKSTDGKKEDFRVVKIEAELILEANRLQLMKQDLEKARMLT
ncbi:retrovirus-related Pol polyprotein from transposon TNT 1-94 [Trichonephila clavipes]|nr:retrovirus-related Pol polyprotein from transposon TNT 1-94 [Trichonephila clavipes]